MIQLIPTTVLFDLDPMYPEKSTDKIIVILLMYKEPENLKY